MGIISTIPLVQQLVLLAKKYHIKHLVISPGSRNAPLVISFTNDPFFKCYSIVDERSAGFFALGMAQQLQTPVALLCTSGSALLNYYPAIAEAYYSDIPLVVFSADRPTEAIDIGDGQTIRQEHVFANHIEYQANLVNEISYNSKLKKHNKKLLKAAFESSYQRRGPVHINVPLYEPLYQTKEIIHKQKIKTKLVKIQAVLQSNKLPNKVIDLWKKSNKILILVGVFNPDKLTFNLLKKLSQNTDLLIIKESTSNLYFNNSIYGIDLLISNESEAFFKTLQPELLITFGGLVVSKRIKKFLRTYPPNTHIHIDPKKAYNTYGCLTHHFKMEVFEFFDQLPPLPSHKMTCSTFENTTTTTATRSSF